jgi:hypothetical protein
MLTIWANVVIFAIALGRFFFKGPSWDQYATVVLILSLLPFVPRFVRDQVARRSRRTRLRRVELRREAEEAALQKIDAVHRRLGELAAGHRWCRTL